MALQGRVWESNVRLLLSGVPVTGVIFGDVTVSYRRAGDTTMQSKLLTADDWVEIENGYYALKWNTSDMANVGPFLFQVTGGTFDPVVAEFDVVPAPIEALAGPEVCLITGNIVDLGGVPGVQDDVIFRLAKRPSAVSGSFVLSDVVRTTPNVYGTFTVALVRGVQVIVAIERVGIRHQVTVPDQAQAQLIDILPPINNIP